MHGTPLIHRLRLMARALAGRVALAWFALSLAVAIASPLAQPQAAVAGSLDMVCTSAGMVELAVADAGGVPRTVSAAHLDCPLCLPLAAPLPPAWHGAPPPRPVVSRVLRPAPTAPIAIATAAPLAARGPPAAA